MPLLLEPRGRVVLARIANPPTDLLDADLMAELDRFGRQLRADRETTVVVLTGPRPGTFVPHYDLAEIAAGTEALGLPTPPSVARVALAAVGALTLVPGAARAIGHTPGAGLVDMVAARRTLARFGRLRQVVIAAIDGDALGGGCELALACDLRVMADGDHLIGLPELTAGIPPGAGGTQRLAAAVGPARALSLILRGTPVAPREALRLGLVDELAAPGHVEAAALVLAEVIAARNPEAVAAAKRSVRASAGSVRTAGLQREAAEFVGAVSRPAALAGLRRFVAASDAAAGRTPWRDRSGL